MKTRVTRSRLKQIVKEELGRYGHNGSDAGLINEALQDLHKASGLLEAASSILHRVGESDVDSIIHNLMAINENLYTQVQILRNADYDYDSSPYSPPPPGKDMRG
jgi:hypothetical protein|tara:strand:- start:28452 stop:28766 length:315 start_codon:yes stop_codon:yes gene_type:complete